MNKTSNLLWGIVLIVLGVIFGVNALGISNINLFFNGWWTLFIIVPCFIDLFKYRDKTGSIIGLIIGIVLLLGCQGIIHFYMIWKLIIPTILIMLGVSFLFKDVLYSKARKEMKKLKRNTDKEYYATFGGQNIDFSNETFDGCSVSAVFGGLKCDLRNAVFSEDCILDASAIFGSTTIYVPEHINVKITSTPIFGGVADKRVNREKNAEITLYINAICMFGGIEIK